MRAAWPSEWRFVWPRQSEGGVALLGSDTLLVSPPRAPRWSSRQHVRAFGDIPACHREAMEEMR